MFQTNCIVALSFYVSKKTILLNISFTNHLTISLGNPIGHNSVNKRLKAAHDHQTEQTTQTPIPYRSTTTTTKRTQPTSQGAQTPMSQPESIAQAQWELENSVESLGDVDKLYNFNAPEYFGSLQSRPWQHDHHYFKQVSISALALLKMSMHAKSGGKYEVMGLMQGKVEGDTFIVLDAFALPVEGTETRVNAAEQANAYMSTFKIASERVLKEQPVVGWYHSHPGYGCWLSGIDVGTQLDH